MPCKRRGRLSPRAPRCTGLSVEETVDIMRLHFSITSRAFVVNPHTRALLPLPSPLPSAALAPTPALTLHIRPETIERTPHQPITCRRRSQRSSRASRARGRARPPPPPSAPPPKHRARPSDLRSGRTSRSARPPRARRPRLRRRAPHPDPAGAGALAAPAGDDSHARSSAFSSSSVLGCSSSVRASERCISAGVRAAVDGAFPGRLGAAGGRLVAAGARLLLELLHQRRVEAEAAQPQEPAADAGVAAGSGVAFGGDKGSRDGGPLRRRGASPTPSPASLPP